MKNILNYIIFSGLIVSIAAVFHLDQQGSLIVINEVQSAVVAPIRPIHITIPAARVNAEVINVGVTKTNNLDVPPNFVQVGWYKYGPLPGTDGNAVIDGHVDNGASIDGVFKHLRDVESGDLVSIKMSDGTLVRYEITGTEVVKTTEFPGHSVFHEGEGAILKIITCHGKFVKAMDTYDQRLIVTAKLIE